MSHLISCPECSKQLQVPDDLIGKSVQCPECQHSFIAAAPDLEVITSTPKKTGSLPVPTKKSAAGKKDGNQEGSKRRHKEDDDDDDYDERPSRRRSASRRSANYETPHRGGMVLAFGIIGLVSGLGIIFGPIAWMMGNNDLRAIEAGDMDPEGESMTRVGQILGMIATIMSIVGILIACGIFVVYFFIIILIFGAMAAGANNKNFPQPR